MSTFKEAYKSFMQFKDTFTGMVESTIQRNGPELTDMIREQLYSGKDGNDNYLAPDYLSDPYFSTPEAGRWQNDAQGYMKWKKKITKPAASYLGYPARPENIPNLIIRGDFYDSIRFMKIADGIRIESQGVSFGTDIINKYGEQILKIGPVSKKHFIEYIFKPDLNNFYTKFR